MPEYFKEINKMAAERIENAVRKLSGQEIKVEFSEVAKRKVRDIKSLLEPERQVVVYFCPIVGALEGAGVLILPQESAFELADYLQKRKVGTTHALTDLDKSAIKELGNIAVCSYLNVIANECKVEVKQQGVRVSQGIFGAISEEVIIEMEKGGRVTHIIEVAFIFETLALKGHILFLFDSEKVKKLWEGV